MNIHFSQTHIIKVCVTFIRCLFSNLYKNKSSIKIYKYVLLLNRLFGVGKYYVQITLCKTEFRLGFITFNTFTYTLKYILLSYMRDCLYNFYKLEIPGNL